MRFVTAAIAGFLWCFIGSKLVNLPQVDVPDWVQFLSLSIVVAGALAGGE